MARRYTQDELFAREQALAQVRTITDLHKLLEQDASATRGLPGKIMNARYAGKCVDCGGRIAEGEEIRYDGKAHHFPACPRDERPDEDSMWAMRNGQWRSGIAAEDTQDRVEREAREEMEAQAHEIWAERRNEEIMAGLHRMPSADEQYEDDRERWLESL